MTQQHELLQFAAESYRQCAHVRHDGPSLTAEVLPDNFTVARCAGAVRETGTATRLETSGGLTLPAARGRCPGRGSCWPPGWYRVETLVL